MPSAHRSAEVHDVAITATAFIDPTVRAFIAMASVDPTGVGYVVSYFHAMPGWALCHFAVVASVLASG